MGLRATGPLFTVCVHLWVESVSEEMREPIVWAHMLEIFAVNIIPIEAYLKYM